MVMMNSTKQRLLNAGLAMLLEHGYNDLGIQALLAATRIPKGSFYHHFKDKEDFALAVTRFTVELFVLYGDALTRITRTWLDRYLSNLDHATVREYPSWDHLERAFTRGDDLAHYEPAATLEMTGVERAQPPTPASPLLRRAVGVALRTAAIDRADWHRTANGIPS